MPVAARAGDSIHDCARAAELVRVIHNGNWAFVDDRAVSFGEQVSLQSIGKTEDHLTAIVLERPDVLSGFKSWPEGEFREVISARIITAVVARPVVAVFRIVPFHDSIVVRDARLFAAETCSHQSVLFEIGLNVDVQQLF